MRSKSAPFIEKHTTHAAACKSTAAVLVLQCIFQYNSVDSLAEPSFVASGKNGCEEANVVFINTNYGMFPRLKRALVRAFQATISARPKSRSLT